MQNLQELQAYLNLFCLHRLRQVQEKEARSMQKQQRRLIFVLVSALFC
jgi:hypothetical protein